MARQKSSLDIIVQNQEGQMLRGSSEEPQILPILEERSGKGKYINLNLVSRLLRYIVIKMSNFWLYKNVVLLNIYSFR